MSGHGSFHQAVTPKLQHEHWLGTLGGDDDLELKPSMLIAWEDYAGLLWG